jgi:hypothetical protein
MILMSGGRAKHLPFSEARRRVIRLARADIVRLTELAGFYGLGLGRDAPDEIFGEAVARVLEGRRPWPAHLTTIPFLAGVMKSIASELKDRRRRDPLSAADTALDDDLRPLQHEGHEASAAVHLLIERIRRELEPDPLLTSLFNLRLEDKSPVNIQAALDLTPAAFDKVMRDLKKRLIEIFPYGYPL